MLFGSEFLIVSLFLLNLAQEAESCAPPINLPPIGIRTTPTEHSQTDNNSRLFGEKTIVQSGGPAIGLGEKDNDVFGRTVKDPTELSCYDFDDQCHWRNVEGLFIDELDWYQGFGYLDERRMRIATGANTSPDGYYAITASDKPELSGTKALLVSDIIECQLGQSDLRFNYWTSVGVQLIVCSKMLTKPLPFYDYCSAPIELNDPGPAIVTLPDLKGQPFQIFIQATNFVYKSNVLEGGFALIDNIEFYGDFCNNNGNGTEFSASKMLPSNTAFSSHNYNAIRPVPKEGLLSSQQQKMLQVPIASEKQLTKVQPTQSPMPKSDRGSNLTNYLNGMLDWMLHNLSDRGGKNASIAGSTDKLSAFISEFSHRMSALSQPKTGLATTTTASLSSSSATKKFNYNPTFNVKFYGPGLPAPPPPESVQKSAKIYGKNQQNVPNMLIDHETAVHGFEGAKLGQNPAVQIDYDGENPISIGAKSPLQRPHQRIPAYRDLHGFSDSLVVNGGGSGRMLSDKKYHQNEALIEMD